MYIILYIYIYTSVFPGSIINFSCQILNFQNQTPCFGQLPPWATKPIGQSFNRSREAGAPGDPHLITSDILS